MSTSNPHEDEQINAYWNALNQQVPEQELARLAASISPANQTVIERLQALHRRRQPDQTFAADLEKLLMSTFTNASARSDVLGIPQLGPLNGRVLPDSRPKPRVKDKSTWSPRRWAMPQLTAALLVVLLLLGSIGGYLALDNRNEHSTPALVPAQQATPTATDWPMSRGNPARTGVQNGTMTGRADIVWRAEFDGSVARAAAVVDGIGYFGSSDGYLHALEAATGEEIWQFQGDASLENAPTVANGMVYIVSQPGTLYAIDAETGAEVWRDAGPAPELYYPLALGDLVYVGYLDGRFAALEGATGEERWSVEIGGGSMSSPSAGSDAVYVTNDDGVLHALDAADGSERWTFMTGEAGTNSPILASVVGDALFVSQPNGAGFWVLDAATGVERYQIAGPSGDRMTWPAITDDAILVGDNDGFYFRLDPADGAIVWSFQTADEVLTSPVVVGGVMLGYAKDFTLRAIDIETGALLWSVELESYNTGLAVADNMAFLGMESGAVYAIGEPGAGTPAATQDQTVSTFASDDVEFLWQSSVGGGNGDVFLLPDGNLAYAGGDPRRVIVMSPDGELVEAWGESGEGEGQMSGPAQIAYDAEGNAYVTEFFRHIVQKFDPDHNFVLSWGGTGTGDGQFLEPSGIAVGLDGKVYVADVERDDIQVFDADGNYLMTIGEPGSGPGQFDQPGHLSVDAEGNLWVPEFGNNRVSKFSPDGDLLFSFGSGGGGEGQFGEANSVALDPAGNIYVADFGHGQVEVFDSEGNFLLAWGSKGSGDGQFLDIVDAVPDGLGNVYASDASNNRIQKFHVLTIDQTGEAAPPETTPTG